MPLSPLDIHNKEFTKSFRGYSEDEVNDFLDQVIKDYEILIKEKRELEEELKKTQTVVENYQKMEETLQTSILLAQETAEDVRSNAINEAKLIVKEAEKNAEHIVNEALLNARKATIEVDELRKQSRVFRSRFKLLVEAQLDLLKTDDWDHLLELEKDITEIRDLQVQEGNVHEGQIVEVIDEKPNE